MLEAKISVPGVLFAAKVCVTVSRLSHWTALGSICVLAHAYTHVYILVLVLCFCAFSVSQSCLALQPHGLPGSSVHGIFQAKILEWVAVSFFICYYNHTGLPQT